jgi:putative methionine-R-sulfoxide reductase with GAF domain/anti-sigma regulatory factor (Ser/Thr protein kinase)
MNNQLNKALKNNRLMKNVDLEEMDLNNINGEVISKNAGQVIYREGDPADSIYMILSGEVNIVGKKNDKIKSYVLKENFFFGNDEFFEEPKRLSTAVALKDCYLIRLPEDDVQKLLQQDTAIYENLRELKEENIDEAVNPGITSNSLPGDLDEIDLALQIDSQIEGISIDNLEVDDPAELRDENTLASSEEKNDAQFTPSTEDEFDDDILKALESEDAYDTTNTFSDNQLDLSKDDEEFFKTFNEDSSSEPVSNIQDTTPTSPPPVKPVGGTRSANDLIDFNFGEAKEDSDEIFDNDDSIKDEIEKLMNESSDETEISDDKKEDEPRDQQPDKEEKIPEEENIEETIPEPERKPISGNQKEGEHMTADDLELINQAAQLVNSNIQLDEVLQNIVDVASNLTHADRGTLYLVDKDNNELWSKVLMGDNLKEVRLKIGEGVAGWVAKSMEVVNIENVKEDTRFQPAVDKNTGYDTKSMLCFPIKNREKEVIGVLQLLNSGNGVFSKLDEEFLNALSIHAALALENANMVQKLLQTERVESLGKMANFLIQDIKKPVLVSKRYAEHLRAKELPPEVIQVLDMMLEQMNSVADLVQTTSSYAEGKKILHTIVVSLAEILIDFSSRMEQYVQLKTCSIVNNFETKAKVKLDVKEFFQCYSHIIKNACDAMPEGGRITVYVDDKDDRVKIKLADEGLGIPDTIKEKIFEPFTSHGKKEGTGLGLAITKKIVEAHSGTIDVESTLGEGATFTISLPKSS